MNLQQRIEHNTRLVHHCAKRYGQFCAGHYEDVVQEGFLALIRIHQTFEPQRKLSFTTYAVPGLRMAMYKANMKERYGQTRSGRHVKELADQIEKRQLEEDEPKVIAQKLHARLSQVKAALALLRTTVVSMDRSIQDDDGKSTLHDVTGLQDDMTSIYVRDFLSTLSERDRRVLELRMDGYTQTEIGSMVGVTQVQISRIIIRLGKQYRIFHGGEDKP